MHIHIDFYYLCEVYVLNRKLQHPFSQKKVDIESKNRVKYVIILRVELIGK